MKKPFLNSEASPSPFALPTRAVPEQCISPHPRRPAFIGGMVAAALTAAAMTSSQAQTGTAAVEPSTQVVEQGKDFGVYQHVAATTSPNGQVRFHTNRFTLLENNLHYRENGQWKLSEDVIESFPEGAVARRGPDRAVFAPDLNSEAVFDILASDGQRIRGGLRAIQATELGSGQSLVLATVKPQAPGQLFPPNRLAYLDCMTGLKADLVLEWRHNRFTHDVILREQPRLPEEWNPAKVRLEIVTELFVDADPELRSELRKEDAELELRDDVVIHFGALAMLMGKAFPLDDQSGFSLGGQLEMDQGTPVLKQWHRTADGRRFLIESVSWPEVLPEIKGLPVVAQAGVPGREVTVARTWPERVRGPAERQPVAVASVEYEPKGYALDFVIVPDSQPTVFVAGEVYVLRTTYYNGNSATFQPGCMIKRYSDNGAALVLYGSISFPDTLQSCVFTCLDDDSYGGHFPGNSNPYLPESDGDPSDVWDDALKIWYVDYSTTVRSALFRWAIGGIEFWSSSPGAELTVRNCRFENLSDGVQISITPSRTVTFVDSDKCSVTQDYYLVQGQTPTTYLTASPFCTEKSFQGVDGSEADVSSVVPDSMGAIGTADFLEVINSKLISFRRSDGQRSTNEMSVSDFFKAPGQGARTMTDPRVLFDPVSQRWFASIVDSTDRASLLQTVVLKVSKSSSADLSSTNWLPRYAWTNTLSSSAQFFDYQTLGSDANGLYVCVDLRTDSTNDPGGYVIQALKKPDVYSPNYTLPARLASTNADLLTWCIQPAFSFDSSPPGGYAWFVAKGPSSTNQGGQIHYRRLQWSGGSPQWADANWQPVTDTVPTYRNYFDIPQGATNAAPQTGGTVNLGFVGSRLMMAVIRSNYLYTCHHVGLDGTNSTYDGGTVDRSAIQWFKFQVSADGLSYGAHHRIYDSAASNPYWYYFPSLSVDANTNIVFGFSGSRTGENVGAFYQGLKGNGTWLLRPVLVQAGRSAFTGYGVGRFGDYSATTIDPNDGSFWTVQEFSAANPDPIGDPIWGTWIVQIKVP